MWWAAEATPSSDSPTLALISAVGAVLTASLPVLISKMRDRSQPKSSAPAGLPGSEPPATGRHHRDEATDSTTLLARIDDGNSLLRSLIVDLQRRAEGAESEVRLMRGQMDSLESVVYQQRSEIQILRAQLQTRTQGAP